ncbi:hypothetical protein [Streptomyces carpinensis]|uniref:Secreted protein n=1 Tax=Streptomyces carpinensis TaxID=66369 RepID=A0ABV1W6E4_9ACTN|nr:hypothetical protein [Streptomyces carpinensis]
MKQRGRHRRRRRGRALRAVLAGAGLALTAAATLISASQATVTDDPGALKPLTSPAELDRLRLTEQPVPERSLDRLASAMGRPVGVGAVLRSADHTLRTEDACTAEERKALPVEPAAARAYCWDTADAATREWRPRSVTTSGDAEADGRWGAHRVILSGWTHLGGGADRDLARVAFVNADDPDRLTYTWALLAVPVDGGRDYRGLASHVSGMVWYQDKLLVTTSGTEPEALYVYDLRRIQRATVTTDAIGRVPGGWSAHGYRWVLPAVAAYRPTEGRCDDVTGTPGTTTTPGATGVTDPNRTPGKHSSGKSTDSPDLTGPAGSTGSTASADSPDPKAPCPNGLSLDRTSAPASLVASQTSRRGSGRHTRLWRYSFSADPARSGLLAADSSGTVTADAAYETKADGVRGVLSRRTGPTGPDRWYLSRAAGAHGAHGTLWRQDLHGAQATECGSSDDTHRCWGDGTGSLSYWESTGELWSLSGRTLFALPLSSVEREMR